MRLWDRIKAAWTVGQEMPEPRKVPAPYPGHVSEWYSITWDDEYVTLDVRPPGREPRLDQFRWGDIKRICLVAEDLFASDGIYVFTHQRPESYAIPAEGRGGTEFFNELINRRLFDAKLAVEFAAAKSGMFCWPPPDSD